MTKPVMTDSDLNAQAADAAKHYMVKRGYEHMDIATRHQILNDFAQGFFCGFRFLEKHMPVLTDSERKKDAPHDF